MFFVLSGLVLSLKYLRREGDMGIHYGEFLVNRFFRIYPACFVVLLFYFFSAHEQDMQGNFLWRWLWGPNMHFWEEASLVRNVSMYFGPVWTLNVEVMLSIIVPLLVLLIRYRPRWFKYLWAISVVWTSFYSMFVFHFMCGIWIAEGHSLRTSGVSISRNPASTPGVGRFMRAFTCSTPCASGWILYNLATTGTTGRPCWASTCFTSRASARP